MFAFLLNLGKTISESDKDIANLLAHVTSQFLLFLFVRRYLYTFGCPVLAWCKPTWKPMLRGSVENYVNVRLSRAFHVWGSSAWMVVRLGVMKGVRILHPMVKCGLEEYFFFLQKALMPGHMTKLAFHLIFSWTQKALKQSEDREGQHPIASVIFERYTTLSPSLRPGCPHVKGCLLRAWTSRMGWGRARLSQLQENLGVWEIS